MASDEERRHRVEEARKKILAEREKLLREAPRLTAELLQGPALSEEIVVKLKTGKHAKITVRALSEGEMLEALASKPNLSLGNLTIGDYDVLVKIAAKATDFTEEQLKNGLAFGESAAIAGKVFELSGFGRESEIESFR